MTYRSISHNVSVAKSCGGDYRKFFMKWYRVLRSESFPKPFAIANWTTVPFLIGSSGQKRVGGAHDNRATHTFTSNSQTLVASDPIDGPLTSENPLRTEQSSFKLRHSTPLLSSPPPSSANLCTDHQCSQLNSSMPFKHDLALQNILLSK